MENILTLMPSVNIPDKKQAHAAARACLLSFMLEMSWNRTATR
jgi:hypothetical protein